jgi:hypothetical protein
MDDYNPMKVAALASSSATVYQNRNQPGAVGMDQ